eukprot:5405683-Prymnesium_polylepis.1
MDAIWPDDDSQHHVASAPPPPPPVSTWAPGRFDVNGGEFRLEWGSFGRPSDPVNFTISAATSGWVSIGWGGRTHEGVDCVVGYVSGGHVSLVDGTLSFSRDPSHSAIVDQVQSISDIRGSESDGVTTISFHRAPRTGDSEDADLTGGPILFHWA